MKTPKIIPKQQCDRCHQHAWALYRRNPHSVPGQEIYWCKECVDEFGHESLESFKSLSKEE